MGTLIACIAAAQLGVSTRTLARWADQGKIRANKTPGGWRLFCPQDVVKLKRQMERRAR